MNGPVSIAIAAELVVVLAICMFAAVLVNGHRILETLAAWGG